MFINRSSLYGDTILEHNEKQQQVILKIYWSSLLKNHYEQNSTIDKQQISQYTTNIIV